METHQRLDEQPKAIRDMTTSKKILEQIKKHGPMNKLTDNKSGNKVVSNMNSRLLNINDRGSIDKGSNNRGSVDKGSYGTRNSQDMTQTQQSNISRLTKASGAGFLSNIVNPKNFLSL